jgi:O-succinylhomoserine sulfhydrylase
MLKGLETLPLRCHAQTDGAETLARWLSGADKLERVIYPGLPTHPQHNLALAQMERPGTMLSIEITDGQSGAFRFLNALRLVRISNNLGDAKSLVTHPTTTTHQRLTEDARLQLGITPGLVRISVGLEDPDDLRQDIEQALAVV